jgi:8-oxo-dGTP diphosphatase
MQDIVGGLLCRGGRILLGKRSAKRAYYPDVWDVPGGHREQGEGLDQALVRELHEEIGVAPTVWRKLAIVHGPDSANKPYELHLYVVLAWDGIPRNLQPDEHEQLAWNTPEEACRLSLAHPDYPELFRQAARMSWPADPSSD